MPILTDTASEVEHIAHKEYKSYVICLER